MHSTTKKRYLEENPDLESLKGVRFAPVRTEGVDGRKAEVLTEAYENGEVAPEKCEDPENFADPQTKYLTYKPWARHLHYTHNFEGDPPPRAEKKKKIAAVLTPKTPWGLTLD